MASVNRVLLIGNLGDDPQVRDLDNGIVATISVATTDRWKDKSGEQQERTEWHRVVFYGHLAEIVEQYLQKGSQVYIEGSLRTRKWEKDGIERYTTEIIADRMQMLGSKGGGDRDSGRSEQRRQDSSRGSSSDYARQTGRDPGSRRSGGGQSSREERPTRRPPPPADFEDFSDDIPFAQASFGADPIGQRLARRLRRYS